MITGVVGASQVLKMFTTFLLICFKCIGSNSEKVKRESLAHF